MSRESYSKSRQNNIPPELKTLRQWANWHGDKVIRCSRTGRNGSSADPNTWSTFAQAVTADPDRLVLVFGPDDGLAGLDVDGCRDAENGELDARATALVQRFPHIYWEISLSGKGLHGIGFGALPDDATGCHPQGIGVFDRARYFVMTGVPLPGHETLGHFNNDDLAAFYREVSPDKPQRPAFAAPALTIEDRDLGNRLRQDAKGSALLSGDNSGYADYSKARFGLANKACFYTDDVEQIARVIRSSGLFKDADSERERDRKAALDARNAVDHYDGPRYDPNHGRTSARLIMPTPPPVFEHGASPTIPGTDAPSCDDVRAELEQARETIRQLRRDKSMLMALLLNPYVAAADKTAVAATLDKATRKLPGEDGLVTLKPGEIANDWRPRAKPGENTDPLNKDGSKPLMSRSAVKRTMASLTMRKFIDARPDKRKVEPKGREPYAETVWLVKPPDSVADFLAPIALFTPAEVTPRKPRTITPQCPTCHIDLQGVTIQTVTIIEGVCPACGEVHRDESASKPRTVTPIITIDPNARAAEHGDHLSTVRSVYVPTVDHLSTCSAPPVATELSLNDDRSETTGPPPNWEAEHRRAYGQLYRGEVAS